MVIKMVTSGNILLYHEVFVSDKPFVINSSKYNKKVRIYFLRDNMYLPSMRFLDKCSN